MYTYSLSNILGANFEEIADIAQPGLEYLVALLTSL